MMSVGKSPTLCWQLPMFEHMRKNMEMHMNNAALPVGLREALAAGHEKLMHYYAIAKQSMHARLATSMSTSMQSLLLLLTCMY